MAVTAAGIRVLVLAAAASVIVYAGLPVSDGGNRTDVVGVQRIEVLEHSLQAKPSVESAQVAYLDQIGRMADQVSALADGVHWTLRTNVERGCGPAYAGTDAEQVYLNVAFSAPIPDELWPQAVQRYPRHPGREPRRRGHLAGHREDCPTDRPLRLPYARAHERRRVLAR
jgi:Lipoprotein confined to pathogenic Mycobacterium